MKNGLTILIAGLACAGILMLWPSPHSLHSDGASPPSVEASSMLADTPPAL